MWIQLRRLIILERILSCEFSSGKVLICVIRIHFKHRTKLCPQKVLRTEIGARKDILVLQDTPACVRWGTNQQDYSPPWNIWLRRILCPSLFSSQQSLDAGTNLCPQAAQAGVGTVKWSLNLLWDCPAFSAWLCSFLSSAGESGRAGEHSQRNIPRGTFPEEHSTEYFTAVL